MTHTIHLDKPTPPEADSVRFQQGWHQLKAIDGAAGAQSDCQPARHYLPSRPLRDRVSLWRHLQPPRTGFEIATIAALLALGNAQTQLKVHLQAALNVGCSREEIVEVMIQIAVHAKFLAVLNGLAFTRRISLGSPWPSVYLGKF